MAESTTHGAAVRERYLIDRGPDDEALERAKASLDRGDAGLGDPDRVLHFTLSPLDGEEPGSAHLISRRIIPSGDRSSLIYGSLREDRTLPIRANYRTYRGQDGEFGTIEEVDEE